MLNINLAYQLIEANLAADELDREHGAWLTILSLTSIRRLVYKSQ
jgi:hypothetical protein